MGAMVGAARRDVDRHVAEQPHAAVGGVAPQRAPLAFEAHLVGKPRRRPQNRSQSSIQNAWRSRKSSSSARDTGARGSASSPGQAANAERDLYGER